MDKNLILLTLYLSSYHLTGYTQSQNSANINAITTAVPFLLIPPDATSHGIGSAGAASTPDVNSIHWNASKLAFMEPKFGFSLSYLPWLRSLVPDNYISYFSGYYSVNENEVIGGAVRFASLGEITFTTPTGSPMGTYHPIEIALDFAYVRKLSDNFSLAMAGRYIYSDLTGSRIVGGIPTFPGESIAADISACYQNIFITFHNIESLLALGLNVSNIGTKMNYSNSGQEDFIPTNLRFGTSYKMIPNDFYSVAVIADVNKLLVPTPPVYGTSSSGNPVIIAGKEPNVSVWNGMLQSFSDAPGGAQEEIREITYSTGLEVWLNDLVPIRAGYFYEAPTKGNRTFYSLGTGIKYKGWEFSVSRLFSGISERHVLAGTMNFTLSVNY